MKEAAAAELWSAEKAEHIWCGWDMGCSLLKVGVSGSKAREVIWERPQRA